MNDSSTGVINAALAALLTEAESLDVRLRRVRAAIDAIRPLTLPAVSVADPEPVAASNLDRAVSGAAPALQGAFRSRQMERLTQAVELALRQAKGPLTVREISDAVSGKGIELDDPRKLADLLYRKSKNGELLKRVANGVYAIRESDDGELTLSSEL